jgi:hypothetical protein
MIKYLSTIAVFLCLGCAKFETIKGVPEEATHALNGYSTIDTIRFVEDSLFNRIVYQWMSTDQNLRIRYSPAMPPCSAWAELMPILDAPLSTDKSFIMDFEIIFNKIDDSSSLFLGVWDFAMTLDSSRSLLCFYRYLDSTNVSVGLYISNGDTIFKDSAIVSRTSILNSRSRISMEFYPDKGSIIFKEGAVLNDGETRANFKMDINLKTFPLNRIGLSNKWISNGDLLARLNWISICR